MSYIEGTSREQRILFPEALDEYISEEWRRLCDEQKHEYLSVLLGHNRFLRRINGRGWLARLLYSRRRLLGARNVLTCETHREALETIFKEGMV